MRKIFAMLMVSILLIAGMGGLAFASKPDDGIMPLWDTVTSIPGSITFDSNTDTGTVSIRIYGNDDVTKITATATLYYQNERGRWVRIPTDWSYSVNSDMLVINETFDAEPGTTYRVLLSASVYVGSTKEAILEEFIGEY